MKLIYISRGRQKEKPLLEYLSKKKKIKYQHFDISSRDKAKSLKNVMLFFKENRIFKPDIILSESLGLIALMCLIAASLSKSRLVLRVKGDPFIEYEDIISNRGMKKKLIKKMQFQATMYTLGKCDCILPISEHIKDKLHRVGCDNIGEPVPIPFSEIERNIINKASERYVITVTNFNFLKKVEPLPDYIDIISKTLREENLTWYIIGDGINLERIKKNEKCKNNQDVVKFLGFQNPDEYYQSARFQLYISGLDGLPNVVFESFKHHLPVIVNKEFPVREISNSGAVEIIDKSEPEKLHAIIQKIASDENQRRSLIEKSQFLLRKYSVDIVSGKLFEQLRVTVDIH